MANPKFISDLQYSNLPKPKKRVVPSVPPPTPAPTPVVPLPNEYPQEEEWIGPPGTTYIQGRGFVPTSDMQTSSATQPVSLYTAPPAQTSPFVGAAQKQEDKLDTIPPGEIPPEMAQEQPIVEEPPIGMGDMLLGQEIGLDRLKREPGAVMQENPISKTMNNQLAQNVPSPLQDFAFSNTGSPPAYGVSKNGTPLRSPAQYALAKDAERTIAKQIAVYNIGDLIVKGDFSIANGIPSTQGFAGKSVPDWVLEISDVRDWILSHEPSLASTDWLEQGRAALGAGTEKAISRGAIGVVAGSAFPGVGTGTGGFIGTIGGFAEGVIGHFVKYSDPVSTKEGRKDLKEVNTAIRGILPSLYDAGLTNEADLITAEIDQTIAMFEALGEYATERDQVSLGNYAQGILDQLRKDERIALQLKDDHEKKIQSIEGKIRTGSLVSKEDLKYAVDNGSVSAQNAMATENLAILADEKDKERDLVINKMITMSYEQMKTDPGVLVFLDDPIVNKLYYDAKSVYDQAKADENQRRRDEYVESTYRSRLEEQRRYDEEQQLLQRAYNLEMANAQAGMATESVPSSALNFGLLGTSGAQEFVNRDKASQVYFEKAYEELNEYQKRLLNKLKED